MKEITEDWLIKKGIISKYNEITLYLISVTIILFFISNHSYYIKLISEGILGEESESFIFCFLIILSGILLSFGNIFIKRNISKIEKKVLLIFAMLINVAIGVSAGFHILEKPQGLLVIFPVINIMNAYFLYILYRGGIITEKLISDKQAEKEEVIIGTIIIIIIFFISQNIFQNYWAITFSICIIYSTHLLELSHKLFFIKRG